MSAQMINTPAETFVARASLPSIDFALFFPKNVSAPPAIAPRPLDSPGWSRTVAMRMSAAITRRRRKAKQKPKERNEEEVALIREAKELLMTRNNMSEEDAHHYIQKCSMDSCTNMVETAQMVLAMMRGA